MHYLDYAATTPVSSTVAAAMVDALTKNYGNPSAQYSVGRTAKALVDDGRATIAKALGCQSNQLFFTSCGTESDNWAIRAALHQNRRVGKHIITTAVEHSAVIQLMKVLEQEGYEVTYLKPDRAGTITTQQVADALREDTALVSMMLVNNEIGVCYPVSEVAALLRIRQSHALLHTDAVQGFLKIPFTAKDLGADFISIPAHKIGGPKGIGALYVNEKVLKTKALVPVIHGGGQEKGLRSGTENVIGMAGFGAAATDTAARFPSLLTTWKALRARLEDGIAAMENADLRINAPQSERIAHHIVSLTVKGIRSETLLHSLSAEGVYVSSGSACSSNTGHASYVLHSFGLSNADADSTIRISFGAQTTEEDVDAFLTALKNSLARLARTTKQR